MEEKDKSASKHIITEEASNQKCVVLPRDLVMERIHTYKGKKFDMINSSSSRVDFTTLPSELQEKCAEQYCEGCDELRKLLLTLWRNGINTNGSCSGIEDYKEHIKSKRENFNPYVSVEVTEGNKSKITDLLINTLNQKDLQNLDEIIISIYKEDEDKSTNGKKFLSSSLSLHHGNTMVTNGEANLFFKSINNRIGRVLIKNDSNPTVKLLADAVNAVSNPNLFQKNTYINLRQANGDTSLDIETPNGREQRAIDPNKNKCFLEMVNALSIEIKNKHMNETDKGI